MMILDEIILIYNKLGIHILDGAAIREDLFLKDLLFEFIKNQFLSENPGIYFPKNRISIPNIYSSFTSDQLSNWNKTRNMLKGFFKKNKGFFLEGKENSELISKIECSHLIEALYALERSIFWFFNYKLNTTRAFEVAGNQALYYSQFFAIVAIMRLLGISITFLPPIRTFLTQINWEIVTIEISTYKGYSGDHKGIFDEFDTTMKSLDLSKFPEIEHYFQIDDDGRFKSAFRISIEEANRGLLDHLRHARMENIYDFTSRLSDPFKYFYGSVGSYINDVQMYCFLEGPQRYYDPPPYHDDDYEDYFANHLESNIYGGWGIYEHFIGDLLKFLIKNLRKVLNTKRYFHVLKKKISYFDEFNSEAKEIILSWI